MKVYHMKEQNLMHVKFDDTADFTQLHEIDYSLHQANWKNWINRKDFAGRTFDSWEDCVFQATQRWDYGLEVVENMLQELDNVDLPGIYAPARKLRWKEDGDEFCMERLRQGREGWWRGTVRERAPGDSVVCIIVNTSTNCGYSPEDILWRGAAALAATRRLEDSGKRVEMHVVNSCSGAFSKNDLGYLCTVKIKGSDDELDMVSCINMVSGWMFRTLFFRAFAHAGHIVTSCLGHSKDIDREKELDLIMPYGGDNRHIVERCYSKYEAIAMIKGLMEKSMGTPVVG